MILLIFILVVSSSVMASENFSKLKKVNKLTRFAFGSCNKEWKEQPLWKYIIADSPQLFLWGGDNIYGDKKPNKDNLMLKYIIQNNNNDYKKLKSKTPIIGIWDDHDYGDNNGNNTYAGKYISQQHLLDFLEEPKDSARRSQEGIYTSYTFGSAHEQVKFILLDNRFHLTEVESSTPSILGQKQWQWLENELKTSTAKINFIVSGIPVLPKKMIRTEEWADYPKEKEKLLSMIRKYNTSGVIFLSGDKHFSAISNNHGYYEIMSSGLTHRASRALVPWLKKRFPKSFFKLNYGLINIKWGKTPVLDIQIKGKKNIALRQKLKLINKTLTPITE